MKMPDDHPEPKKQEEAINACNKDIDLNALYLHEINQYPRLSRDDEIALAKRIEEGNQEAKDRFIQSNLRLGYHYAQVYHNEHKEISLGDLIQAANIGLMKAVDKYDYRKGPFARYAKRAIIESVQQTIGDDLVIGSENKDATAKRALRIQKVKKLLTQQLGRDPSLEEIAAELGESVDKVIEAVERSQRPETLQQVIGEDGDTTLEELIEDITANNPSEVIVNKEKVMFLGEAIDSLNEIEQYVIKARNGFPLNDGQIICTSVKKSYQSIGERWNMTGENARLIEKNAMAKLILFFRDKGLLS